MGRVPAVDPAPVPLSLDRRPLSEPIKKFRLPDYLDSRVIRIDTFMGYPTSLMLGLLDCVVSKGVVPCNFFLDDIVSITLQIQKYLNFTNPQ